jgi:hypothetical protein
MHCRIRRRTTVLAVALGVLPGRLAAQAPSLPAWVQADSTGRTVALALAARGGGPDGIATLNGYHHGSHQIVVPLGWTVRWTWVNEDSTASHSLVVMAEREKLPAQGGAPAFENALTRAVLQGLKPGQQDRTTFVADRAGWYWMLCGVPGHAIRGEWMGLWVGRDVAVPGVRTLNGDRGPGAR